MSNSIRTENISIQELKLWDENARFPEKYFEKEEGELIKHFCSKPNFKIKELTQSIVDQFNFPQLEKLVVLRDGEKSIVLEWNRRLTVYKLLSNPDLAPNKTVKSFFLQQKKEVNIDSAYSLECIVTEDLTLWFTYIERKHIHGNNQVNWGDLERTHYKVRSWNANNLEIFKAEIAKLIKTLDLPEALKESVLGPGYVTNFRRIIGSKSAWEKYWYSIEDKKLLVSYPDFQKELKVIIINTLEKEDFSGNKINSRSLNKNSEQKTYLQSITKEDYAHVEKSISEKIKTNLFDQKTIVIEKKKRSPLTDKTQAKQKSRARAKSTTRSYLIPKSFIIKITEPKINNIYRELRDDLCIDDSKKSVPNAVWVLFRVFLEVSLDYYAAKNWFSFSKDDIIKGKIGKVTNDLESKKIADGKSLKNIRKVASDKSNILHIDNFHSYVHSYKSQPTPSSLKLQRDNLEEFFEILWKTF